MNKPVAKPKKIRILNSKLLPIAALVLIVLALLFMATPLLRASGGFQRNGNFVTSRQWPNPSAKWFPVPGRRATEVQRLLRPRWLEFAQPADLPWEAASWAALPGRSSTSWRCWFRWPRPWACSLPNAGDRFWGSLWPFSMAWWGWSPCSRSCSSSSLGLRNPFSLILGIAHVVLALAVIVLASIPAKTADNSGCDQIQPPS